MQEKCEESMDNEKHESVLHYLNARQEEIHKTLLKVQDNILVQENRKITKSVQKQKFWQDKSQKIKEEIFKIMTFEEKIKSLKNLIEHHEQEIISKDKQILEEFRFLFFPKIFIFLFFAKKTLKKKNLNKKKN